MPEISRFFGIVITMYSDDHPPPHFHARYAEFKALIEIETGSVIRGFLPSRALKLVEQWRLLHKPELLADWDLAQNNQEPTRITPLS